MTEIMYQCRLRQGETETTAWIEERGAKQGAHVTITDKGMDGLWRVADVYHPPLPIDALRAKQKNDRGCFPSLMAEAR